MITYQSDLKTISSSEEMVFAILSDLNNLQKFSDNPELADKAKDMRFDADSCSFSVDGFGRLGFRIVERKPVNTIRFESENAPLQLNVVVELTHISENETSLKLVLNAELPMMIKMMVDKKLKEGINVVAEMLAQALTPNP